MANQLGLALQLVMLWTPRFLAALVVLLVGYLVARLLAGASRSIAARLGMQPAADRSGLTNSLQQAGVARTVPELIGAVVFWLLLSVVAVMSLAVLQLPGMDRAINNLVASVPNVLIAVLVIIFGLQLSAFLRGVVAATAMQAKVGSARQLANGCYYLLVLITFLGAFAQLGIHFQLLNDVLLLVLAAVGLAFGLSVGLGGREIVSGLLCGYYLRQRFQPGDRVRVAGYEGTVREVGPIATVIETENDGLLNRHSIPNHLMLSESVR